MLEVMLGLGFGVGGGGVVVSTKTAKAGALSERSSLSILVTIPPALVVVGYAQLLEGVVRVRLLEGDGLVLRLGIACTVLLLEWLERSVGGSIVGWWVVTSAESAASAATEATRCGVRAGRTECTASASASKQTSTSCCRCAEACRRLALAKETASSVCSAGTEG